MGGCITKTGGMFVGCIHACTGNDELGMAERTHKEMSLGEMEQGHKDNEPDPYLEGVREYPCYNLTNPYVMLYIIYTYTQNHITHKRYRDIYLP